jgi:uncharacterized membrane protein YgdD (TMEM256/DUF423 family)
MRELAAPLGSAAMERALFVVSGVYGFLAVALGAFGAHALRPVFARAADAAKRLEWWQTASHYHLAHAVAIAVAALLLGRTQHAAANVAGGAFAGGVLVFSGTLYAMALGGPRWLGAITPIGGTLLLVGWGALVVAALAVR